MAFGEGKGKQKKLLLRGLPRKIEGKKEGGGSGKILRWNGIFTS